MSERKVLNKYYPPDFDPSKIPRMKLAKNRQYTVRLMAPFNMRCVTCGEYIYKGKKFNARKEDVEDQTYLGIRIYRFYIKCTRCLQEISFKTDPQNTDYEIEAGATRNFMALKLAEEQARREEQEAREEEANNPMKMLENRTEQSRNEIELLESLEELKDLNRRHQTVDYEEMLMQFNTEESERDREERLQRLDEEYIKNVKFHSKIGTKRVASEEIIEVEDLAKKPLIQASNASNNDASMSNASSSSSGSSSTGGGGITTNIGNNKPSLSNNTSKFVKPSISIGGLTSSKNSLKNLVKVKSSTAISTTNSAKPLAQPSEKETPATKPSAPPANALSLLSGYDDDDSNDSNQSD